MGLGINIWGKNYENTASGTDIVSGAKNALRKAGAGIMETFESIGDAVDTSRMLAKVMDFVGLEAEEPMQPLYEELTDILRYAEPENECTPEMNAVYANMHRLCISMVKAGLVEEE